MKLPSTFKIIIEEEPEVCPLCGEELSIFKGELYCFKCKRCIESCCEGLTARNEEE